MEEKIFYRVYSMNCDFCGRSINLKEPVYIAPLTDRFCESCLVNCFCESCLEKAEKYYKENRNEEIKIK